MAGIKQCLGLYIINNLFAPFLSPWSLDKYQILSPLQVGAKCLETAVFGAVCNVRINLGSLADADYVAAKEVEVAGEMKKAEEGCKKVLDVIEKRSG
jgi:formiminotetrahydrofolate cyclodeaminase